MLVAKIEYLQRKAVFVKTNELLWMSDSKFNSEADRRHVGDDLLSKSIQSATADWAEVECHLSCLPHEAKLVPAGSSEQNEQTWTRQRRRKEILSEPQNKSGG